MYQRGGEQAARLAYSGYGTDSGYSGYSGGEKIAASGYSSGGGEG